jgi:hypothetical protein
MTEKKGRTAKKAAKRKQKESLPESPKISEELEALGLVNAGLPPETAAKAARHARLGREAEIPKLKPDKQAYRKEFERLIRQKTQKN